MGILSLTTSGEVEVVDLPNGVQTMSCISFIFGFAKNRNAKMPDRNEVYPKKQRVTRVMCWRALRKVLLVDNLCKTKSESFCFLPDS
jgi:hypothetical protein